MLQVIGIPGRNSEQDRLLRARLVARRHQLRRQLGIIRDDAGLSPDLDAPTLGIVDQEEIGIWIVGEVAGRDVLPVARLRANRLASALAAAKLAPESAERRVG